MFSLHKFDFRGVSLTLVVNVLWSWFVFLWTQFLDKAVTCISKRARSAKLNQDQHRKVPRTDGPRTDAIHQGGRSDRSGHRNEIREASRERTTSSEPDLTHQLRSVSCQDTPQLAATTRRKLDETTFRGFHEYRDF